MSFFGIGILVICLNVLIGTLNDFLIPLVEHPAPLFLFLVEDYAGSIAIWAYWWIGTWRAANKRARQDNASLAPFFAKFGIVLYLIAQMYAGIAWIGPQFSDVISAWKEDPQWGERGVKILDDGSAIEVFGALTRSVSEQLASALTTNQSVRVVVLDSHGGRFPPARAMMQLIRSRGLDTLVKGQCSSHCVLAFLGGKRRCAVDGALIGFHSPTFGGETAESNLQTVRDLMIAAGVDKAFLDKAFSSDPSKAWYPSMEELVKARVVTNVLDKSIADPEQRCQSQDH
jgi:hypothetical protein